MFRLFLIDLIENPGSKPKQATTMLPSRKFRNRRIYERFDIDHKHLTLMNDQDILLVRDISSTGFSTEVSERGFKRMKVGEIYICRIRYLGEVFETQAEIMWKEKNFVGFSLIEPQENVQIFFNRLLKPMLIGANFQHINKNYQEHSNDKLDYDWFHSTEGVNLFIWYSDQNLIRKWIFEDQFKFIKWNSHKGLQSGQIDKSADPEQIDPWAKHDKIDNNIDKTFKQFALDVFMAAPLQEKENLIQSIEETQ